jgi:mannosyltransferase OCH1-like enzyme
MIKYIVRLFFTGLFFSTVIATFWLLRSNLKATNNPMPTLHHSVKLHHTRQSINSDHAIRDFLKKVGPQTHLIVRNISDKPCHLSVYGDDYAPYTESIKPHTLYNKMALPTAITTVTKIKADNKLHVYPVIHGKDFYVQIADQPNDHFMISESNFYPTQPQQRFIRRNKNFLEAEHLTFVNLMDRYTKLYQENHYKYCTPEQQNQESSTIIPLTTHLIWVGDDDNLYVMPDSYWHWYKNSLTVLDKGWNHIIWTNTPLMRERISDKVQQYNLRCDVRVIDLKKGYDHRLEGIVNNYLTEKKWGSAADCLRLMILQKQGGVYLDVDYEVKQDLRPFHEHYHFYGAVEPLSFFVGNAIFASIPGHPALMEALSLLVRNHDHPPHYITNLTDPMYKSLYKTGPALLTIACHHGLGFYGHKDIILSPTILYPTNTILHPSPRRTIIQPGKPVPPASFGVHYWELSHLYR